MKSIEQTITNTIIIQKSKFICKLIPLKTTENVKRELEIIKQEYKGATHYCYAYICDTEIRSSDDGEPSGTAGTPILNVLVKNNLTHILAIVVRYFGGIKLGAGGLVRAYSKVTTEALNQSVIIELIKGVKISCSFSYSNEKQMEYLLSQYQIVRREYQEQITYQVEVPEDEIQALMSYLKPYADIQILTNIYITKS